MHITGITTCVNKGDYLAWTLPSMRTIFDRLVVITDKKDELTKKLCDFWWVECLQTDIFYKDGAKFNKGEAIRLGLDYINPKEWIVHVDCDIFFGPRFNEFIRCRNFNKDCIYGVDRLNIKDWETWINFYTNPFPQYHVGSIWPGFEVMYRVVQGYNFSPIGFFQMWNTKSKYYKGYPTNSENAADSDLKFAEYWPPENRILIPEVYVYHLSSETTEIGVDWNGRTTKRFGP